MQVCWVRFDGVEEATVEEIPALLRRADGFLWVDIATCDAAAEVLLRDQFGCHPIAIRDCLERNFAPKLHTYPDCLFLVLHSPEPGERGQVHLVEVDQFISTSWLLTVHGPLGDGVSTEVATRDTDLVRAKLESGRLQVSEPAELSHAIASTLAARQEDHVAQIAAHIALLERSVLGTDDPDPQKTLDELFRLRHELLTVRTMSAESREVYARMASLARHLPEESRVLVDDLMDRFDRVRSLCDGEREFLQGILDYHQSRTTTKMNHAMERLALITAVALPITAIGSIYGMNVIVRPGTRVWELFVVLAVMIATSAVMLAWARRQGWW